MCVAPGKITLMLRIIAQTKMGRLGSFTLCVHSLFRLTPVIRLSLYLGTTKSGIALVVLGVIRISSTLVTVGAPCIFILDTQFAA